MDAEFFLFLGQYIITVFCVWLTWRLGTKSQRQQRRLDALNKRFAALTQLMEVADNVPPDLGGDALLTRLRDDHKLYGGLSRRLVRLLGLRRELAPYLELEVCQFVDDAFRPLFATAAGSYELDPAKIGDFAAAAVRFRDLVYTLEVRLRSERERLVG